MQELIFCKSNDLHTQFELIYEQMNLNIELNRTRSRK